MSRAASHMTWSADNPMLDIHGNPTDRHTRWVTDTSTRYPEWELEDTVGRLQVRVTALERLWERVADLEECVDGLSCR